MDLLIQQKSMMIEKYYTDEVGYAITNMLLCFLVFIMILLVYTTSISGLKRIELVSKLLNITVEDKKWKKERSKGKEYEKVPDEPKDYVI